MRLRRLILLVLAVAAVAVLCGCSSKSDERMYLEDTAYSEPMYSEREMPTETAEESGSAGLGGELISPQLIDTTRKLIYTAYYTIESKQFDTDYNTVITALADRGGFVASETTEGVKPQAYGDMGRTAKFTFRIPVANYANFLNDLAGVGECTSKKQTADDVTVDYYDNEARIELYQQHYDKLMEYLKNATEMEDIIALEDEITDVLYRLDALKGQKRFYDDQIDYTTVHVTLKERVAAGEVATSKQTLGSRISEAFTGVLQGLGVFFEGFLVVLIAALPILAVLAIPFCAIFFPIRAAGRRKARRKAEAAAKVAEEAKAEKAE